MKRLSLLPLPLIALLFIGCVDNPRINPEKFTKEVLHGKVVDYDPPKWFRVTYKLDNGFTKEESISKRCSVKNNIIGSDVTVIRYVSKKLNSNGQMDVYYVLQQDKEYFCN